MRELGFVVSTNRADTNLDDIRLAGLDRMHVTTVDNFWRLVQAAHYNSTVTFPQPGVMHRSHWESSALWQKMQRVSGKSEREQPSSACD